MTVQNEIDTIVQEDPNLPVNPDDIVYPEPSTIDIDKAIKYRLHNKMTFQMIADQFGVTKQAVHKALKPYVGSTVDVKSFEKNLVDMLKLKRAELLCGLTQDKQKKMSGLQLITGAGILTDKIRLEQGQATSMVMYANISSELKDLRKEQEAIEAEIETL